MGFYDLPKPERIKLVQKMHIQLFEEIKSNTQTAILAYFSNQDTYIRKTAYLEIGKIYHHHESVRQYILDTLKALLNNDDFKVRQSTINAAGEIGMTSFSTVEHLFETGLFDGHHSVRNAVIGSMKKVGQKNSVPLLSFARIYLLHPHTEVRREICHGIELRGRTHPEDVLPLLEELQYEKKRRVRNMVIHVLGQIAYKKGCLEKVIAALNHWSNKELTQEAVLEILDVHIRYADFSFFSYEEAKHYIQNNYKY